MNNATNENNDSLPGVLYTSSTVYLALVGLLGVGLNTKALVKLIKIVKVF